MAFQPSVSNRLHRSGAIDFNVEFNTRQAQLHKQPCEKKRKMFEETNIDDVFSVCEGEPLYSFSSKRANFNGGCMSLRKPIQLLSSLNGYNFEINPDPDTTAEDIRNEVFKTVCPTGVSVTKWDFRMAGKQGDLFVATIGGLNTIYVDEDVVAGNVLVVDLPMGEHMEKKLRFSNSVPTGFIDWQVKRGVPKTKKTLVVRPMPTTAEDGSQVDLEDAFRRRGQVIGRCVKSAKKGERCDLVLTANAIGMNKYTIQ
jgi:hypothetical protein